MAIQFRDRALKEGEKSHYYCIECEQELPHDFLYSHKCNPLLKNLKGGHPISLITKVTILEDFL